MSRLNLDSLEKGVCLNEMIEVYKIIIIIEGVDKDWLFPLTMQLNRGHQTKVAGARFKTSKRRMLTKLVIHRLWSSLPEDAVDAGASGGFGECLKNLF